ncbi:GntR family transcriptional regulator [Streptomyces sp. NPDC087901]|uniref:GntR family transcriptional regulator n=1 Tax=Streptomyces sp. NPDC087901 TaxID=3365818 RepID=UPI0037F31679
MPGESTPNDRERPAFQRIAAELRAKILDGALRPGERAPSEMELKEHHNVSKMTARNALVSLRDQGVLESRHGKGFFVRSFEPIRRNATRRLSKELWGGGQSMWSVDVHDRPMEPVADEPIEALAPAGIARTMRLASTDRVCVRSRVYLVDGVPVMTAVSYLPLDLVANSPVMQVDTGPGGIYARLADLGHEPKRFREELRSRMPTPEEAGQLAMGAGTPVMHIVRTAADATGRIVEVNDMLLDASRFVMEYDFTD